MARLEALFDLYAADLKRFAPTLAGQFGCPLCLAPIPRSVPLRNVVAEEHVIPSALGGRITTLTCRRCNNDLGGSQLESHLVQRVLVEACKRPIDVTLTMQGAVMRGEMPVRSSPDEPHPIRGIGKRSDPRQVAAIQELMKAPKDEIHLDLNFGYSERRALVAVLRAAYLLMFRTFGYRYLLDASAKPVREQILNWKRDLPVLDGITWRVGEPFPSESMVALMRQPEKLRCFMVLLHLDAETRHTAGVSLPVPGSDGEDLYARIREYRSSGTKTTVTATPLLLPDGFLPFPVPRRRST